MGISLSTPIIFDAFQKQYATKEEAGKIEKVFSHSKDELTKNIMTTKLKNIRLKYRIAVDSGGRGGHRKVVFLHLELCEQICSGSPAIDKINIGIETTDLSQESRGRGK